MTQFGNMPIKQKLIVIIMSVTAAALLLSGIGVIAIDSVLFRKSMGRDISALAQIVADNSTAAMDFDDVRVATETLSSLRARPHLVSACLYRPDHSIFARYVHGDSGAACPPGTAPTTLFSADPH